MGVRVLAVTMATALILCGSAVFGQCCGGGAAYVPAAPVYAAYYAPAAPAYTTYYAPSTAYYAPAPVPYAAYYAPPAAYSTYYAPRVAYAPAVVAYPYARPGWSMYGTPRVYVTGEPRPKYFASHDPLSDVLQSPRPSGEGGGAAAG